MILIASLIMIGRKIAILGRKLVQNAIEIIILDLIDYFQIQCFNT